MMQLDVRRALAAVCLACCAQLGAAAPACGPYSVAMYEFGALYYRNADQSFSGIDKDVIEALARRSGCILEQRLDSRVRIWDQLARGTLDITVSGVETAERLKLAEFYPYISTRNFALLRKTLAPQFTGAEAFLAAREHRIAVVRGFRYGPQLDALIQQLREQGRVDEVADMPTLLRVLKAGRVSLIFVHPFILAPWQAELEPDFKLLDWAPTDHVVGALVVARNRVSAADRQLLRQHLDAMLLDGEVLQILRRHLSPEMSEQLLYRPKPAGALQAGDR